LARDVLSSRISAKRFISATVDRYALQYRIKYENKVEPPERIDHSGGSFTPG
jgi:hypothetical protein